MALAHPDELRWSTKPPTEPGYYWIVEEGEVPHVVQINIVSDSTNMFEVLLPGDEMKYSIEMWGGALWCGPLQHPE
jgi:hypothetical protein